MSLERKDVRGKLDPAYHTALRDICESDGIEIGELIERLLIEEIHKRLHGAIRLAPVAARLGISGNGREKPGISGGHTEEGGRRTRRSD